MRGRVLDTPWKAWNWVCHWASYPGAHLLFAVNAIAWGHGWRFYGVPIIQKHRHSTMSFGPGLQLRSTVRSNPLAPNHPVVLSTWREGAVLEVGANLAMTGGCICAAQRITIGDRVVLGANVTIVEGLAHLDEIRCAEVELVALPLKITGGDGSPVRAIAIEKTNC